MFKKLGKKILQIKSKKQECSNGFMVVQIDGKKGTLRIERTKETTRTDVLEMYRNKLPEEAKKINMEILLKKKLIGTYPFIETNIGLMITSITAALGKINNKANYQDKILFGLGEEQPILVIEFSKEDKLMETSKKMMSHIKKGQFIKGFSTKELKMDEVQTSLINMGKALDNEYKKMTGKSMLAHLKEQAKK